MQMRRWSGWLRWWLRCAAALAGGAAGASGWAADAVVAADGSGAFRTIRAAIDAAPQLTSDTGRRWTILVKAGTYREIVYVQREKRFIRLVGEDAARTTLTFDLFNDYIGPDGKIIATFRTPTLIVDADDFTVEDLTIENAAGPKGQALAIRVDGDRVAFRRCRFLGWQDTILANRGRHYFEDCHIAGAVDFIFGGATAWFERCEIHAAGDGYTTAASTPDFQRHGFVFSRCRITAADARVRTYLGRPWRDFAKTVFLHTEMAAAVRPAGWDNWNKPLAEKAAFYAEHGSTGPGAAAAARVPWARQLTETEAARFSVATVLGGDDGWNPTAAARTK